MIEELASMCKALLVLCLIIFSLFFIFNQADYQKEKISNINSNKVTLGKGEKEIVFNKEKYNELVDYINNSDYLQYKRGKLFVTINNIDKFSNIIASDKEIDVDINPVSTFIFYKVTNTVVPMLDTNTTDINAKGTKNLNNGFLDIEGSSKLKNKIIEEFNNIPIKSDFLDMFNNIIGVRSFTLDKLIGRVGKHTLNNEDVYQVPINESDYIEIVFIDDKIKEISFSTLFDTTINNINFMKEDKSKK